MFGAFQSDAFQNNAFQILYVGSSPPIIDVPIRRRGGGGGRPFVAREAKDDYQRESSRHLYTDALRRKETELLIVLFS
jgi:hypothetical protein